MCGAGRAVYITRQLITAWDCHRWLMFVKEGEKDHCSDIAHDHILQEVKWRWPSLFTSLWEILGTVLSSWYKVLTKGRYSMQFQERYKTIDFYMGLSQMVGVCQWGREGLTAVTLQMIISSKRSNEGDLLRLPFWHHFAKQFLNSWCKVLIRGRYLNAIPKTWAHRFHLHFHVWLGVFAWC